MHTYDKQQCNEFTRRQRSLPFPKVWFHNRDKLLFITLYNQLGRYVEWLYFPMIHIRFALGPAEHD
jgi:hypothetical protein